MTTASAPHRIVVLGGGFAGAYAFRALHRYLHGDPGTLLTLVNNTNYFLFTPLLHEVATGGVAPSIVVEPLRKVLGCCLEEFHLATVEGINLDEQQVLTSQGHIPYDSLVVALGATTNFYGVEGAAEHAFTLKTLDDAVRLKNHLITQFERASHETDQATRRKLLRFVVVGGGPTGVELAAELADFTAHTFRKLYRHARLMNDVHIVLLETGAKLMAHLPDKLSAASERILRRKGVDVQLNSPVVRLGDEVVELKSGSQLATTTPIWVAGVMPQPLELTGAVERGSGGRLTVEPTLQLKQYPNVFVIGDLAHAVDGAGHPLPALAQVASKQGPAAARNLVRVLRDQQPTPYTYHHAGDLVSLGHWMAVANIKHIFFTGRFAWWLWRTIYLSKLLSLRKKFKVAVDWTFDLFEPRDISQA